MDYDDVLVNYYGPCFYHHGIKGQKWGVRRTPEQLGYINIERGRKVYRTSANKNDQNVGGSASFSNSDIDRNLYKAKNGYINQLIKKGRVKSEDGSIYETEYELKKDAKIPDTKASHTLIKELYSNDKQTKWKKDVANFTYDFLGGYEGFMKSIKNKNPKDKALQTELKQILKDYKKSSYDDKKNMEQSWKSTLEDLYTKKGNELLNSKDPSFEVLREDLQPEYMTSLAATHSKDVRNVLTDSFKNNGYDGMVEPGAVFSKNGKFSTAYSSIILFDKKGTTNVNSTNLIDERAQRKADKDYTYWLVNNNKMGNYAELEDTYLNITDQAGFTLPERKRRFGGL